MTRIVKFSVNYTADLTRIEIGIVFEPSMIAIFQLCLLPKMRLSVDLEGRFTGYQNSDLALFRGDLSQGEKCSENKQPLKPT